MAFNLPSIIRSKDNLFERKANDVDEIFHDFVKTFYQQFPSLSKTSADYFIPKFDVSETSDSYLLEVDLPGLEQKDIDINVDNNVLTIKGKKETNVETKKKNYFTRERSYGEFQRSLTLPSNTDSSKIDAKFKNGVLEVSIPKVKTGASKKIEIK